MRRHSNDHSLSVTRRSMSLGLTTAALAAALPTPRVFAQPALRPITLSLDFIPLGRFAPWYVAVGKGYYKEAGST